MDRPDIMDEMRGRWRSVLPAFGLSARELSGRNGPCPLCPGGKDRWRFLDTNGDGTWICNVCGAGSGVELVKRLKGLGFREACAALRRELGAGDHPAAPANGAAGMADGERRQRMNAIWRATRAIREGDEVDRYLRSRHFGRAPGEYPADLRFHPALAVKGVPGFERMPAMVALVRGPDGRGATLHRTYLRDGAKAPIESPRRIYPGKIPEGSAVRLAPVSDGGLLAVSEGIETALAATAMWGVPAWALLSTGQMRSWVPPGGVKRVQVLADNDPRYGGHAAAYALAHRLACEPHCLDVDVLVPPTDGFDWADEWARTCEQGALV